MLGVSQPRISQLVKKSELIAHKDVTGELQIDRESVERYATKRAVSNATSPEEEEAKRARHEEANDRFARERKRARAADEARTRKREELHERSVTALERIAECLHRAK